jgi:hypothetical protein
VKGNTNKIRRCAATYLHCQALNARCLLPQLQTVNFASLCSDNGEGVAFHEHFVLVLWEIPHDVRSCGQRCGELLRAVRRPVEIVLEVEVGARSRVVRAHRDPVCSRAMEGLGDFPATDERRALHHSGWLHLETVRMRVRIPIVP